MKTSTTAYALAASFLPFVLASPYHVRRHAEPDVVVDVVTNVEVVTAVTEVVVTQIGDAAAFVAPSPTTWITFTAPSSSSSSAPEEVTSSRDHKHHWTLSTETPVTTSSSTPPPSSSASPSSTSTTSSTPAPVPSTTSTSSTPAPAPSTTSTSQAVWTPAPLPSITTPSVSIAVPVPTSYPTGDASYSSPYLEESTLNSTNFFRSMFGASPLAWNDSLASMALNTASSCNWEHTNAGQNLDAGYSTPQTSVDTWGNEFYQFDFSNPSFTENTGHFTQLVWKDTTTVGCAAYNCPYDSAGGARGWFYVCNYLPVGNMDGEYAQNVGAKVS